MKFSWKNIENWHSWKMRFFWGGHFEFLKSAIFNFFLFHFCEKSSPFIWGIIFSALWMVFPESWKRSCQNFYAHDCKCSNRISNIKSGVVRSKIELLCWKTYIRRLLTFLSSASSINKQVLLELVSKELNRLAVILHVYARGLIFMK